MAKFKQLRQCLADKGSPKSSNFISHCPARGAGWSWCTRAAITRPLPAVS